MKKRVLVTGGFGFIGSWLVEALLQHGHDVHVVDDLRSAVVKPVDILYEWSMGYKGDLTFDVCSIEDYANKDFHHPSNFDVIYHLASPVGPAGILNHYGTIVQQVVSDSYAVIGLARRWKSLLVYVSTSEVYGGGQNGLCGESMPKIIQPDTTVRLEYAVAKLAMETAIINNTVGCYLDAVIVRPFNVAGPRQKSKGGFVLPRFVELALAGRNLTIFGDGSQVRAFTHVGDIAKGLMLIAEKGVSGDVYNLGNDANRTTINELADVVIAETGANVGKVQVNPKNIYGPLYAEAADKYPDTEKITALGWKPEHDLRSIVADTVTFFSKVKVGR